MPLWAAALLLLCFLRHRPSFSGGGYAEGYSGLPGGNSVHFAGGRCDFVPGSGAVFSFVHRLNGVRPGDTQKGRYSALKKKKTTFSGKR